MGAGEDRISGLPDKLLLCILARLGSARAAVRTGVLSRRWRHILGPLPLLLLDGNHGAPPPPLESVLDKIDAALAACDAPIFKRLDIGFGLWSTADGLGVPAMRAARWLRFASERVVDGLYIYLPRPEIADGEQEAVLELPACEAVTTIQLVLVATWQIQPSSAGLFRALTDLRIRCGSMDGGELAALVCTQCPCLVNLKLSLMELVNSPDVSIRSDSMQSLDFAVNGTLRLQIVAPRLEKLSLSCIKINEARICAPKLAELGWSNGSYDPDRHQFEGVGRRLRVLKPGRNASLMRQLFEQVDELSLSIWIGRGIAEYRRFLNETKNLPKCNILNISVVWNHHGFVPCMLHLLRSCNSTRKVSLFMHVSAYEKRRRCDPSCPCRFEKSHRIDDISLNSLEEVEITSYTSSQNVLEFVEQLSRCSAAQLKKVVMKHKMKKIKPAPPPTKEAREKICRMFQPNIEVEFYVFSKLELVRLD
nr:unnamed protein product [Digitaria exilis]